MKLLMGVLLLCFVFVVKGLDPCTKGVDAMEVFMNLRKCEQNILDLGRDYVVPFFRNATLNNLRNAVSGYCSVVFPVIRDCFRVKIQNCSNDQRAVLIAAMEDTGFLCLPNSTTVHPRFAHLMAHFSDADFEGDGDCEINVFDNPIHEECSNETLTAMGYPSKQELRQFLRNATVEQLMPNVPIYFNTFFECGVTLVRDMPNRCGNWRGQVIHQFKRFFFPSILGRTMTFTTDQLDAMFEFQDNQEASTDQPALSLLSGALFKGP